MKTFACFVAALLASASLAAQCDFTPTVGGDNLLCPNAQGVLSTQAYDSYQWYKRTWPDGAWAPISGATSQTLTITQDDVLYYFRVDATQGGCTEASAEILVDGLVFLLPVVSHEGDYTFDPELESFVVCQGDTMFLTLLSPYDTNITWFRNGQPLPETGATLAVATGGNYTVEGAPSICPNFIQPLGLTITVRVVGCTTSVGPQPNRGELVIGPNPVNEVLHIRSTAGPAQLEIQLRDAAGRLVLSQASDAVVTEWNVDLQHLPAGVYMAAIQTDQGWYTQKIVKQ